MTRFDSLRGVFRPRWSYLAIIGLVFYAVVASWVGWGDLAAAFARTSPAYLAAFLVVESAALWLRAFKWRIVLGPGRQAVRVCFMSKAGGNLTPARLGEWFPLFLREYRTSHLGAWILLDRILEVIATLAFGFVGLLLVVGVHGRPALILLTAVVLFGFLAGWVVVSRPQIFEYAAHRTRHLPRCARALDLAADVARELRGHSDRFWPMCVLTAIAKSLDIVVALLLLLSLGYLVPVAVLAVTQCIHGLTSMIPFAPNATGVPYATSLAFLHEVGAVPVAILAAAVPLRVVGANLVFWLSFALAMQKREPAASAWASAGSE